MKIIKTLTIVFVFFIGAQISAQETEEIKPFTKKRMKWMDKDKSGAISFEEFKNRFKDKKNKNGEPLKYGRMFLGLDANNDDEISLEELNKKVDWKASKTKVNKMTAEEAAKYDITL